MRVSTMLLASLALHTCVDDVSEAIDAASVTNNDPTQGHSFVDDKKDKNPPQRLLRANEVKDDDERMFSMVKSIALNVKVNNLARKPSEEIFKQIRAGSTQETRTSAKVENALQTMKDKRANLALLALESKQEYLVKLFIEAWEADVVAIALAKAKSSDDAHTVEFAKILSRQLMKFWEREMGDDYVKIFNELKIDKLNHGFFDGRIDLLNDYITFKNNGVSNDKRFIATLRAGFKSDAVLGIVIDQAKKSIKASDLTDNLVLDYSQKVDALKTKFLDALRQEKTNGADKLFDRGPQSYKENILLHPNFQLLGELFRQSGEKEEIGMKKLDQLISWFGSEGNVAILLSKAIDKGDRLKSVGERYQKRLFRRLMEKGIDPSKVKDVVFKDVAMASDDAGRVEEFAKGYQEYVQLRKSSAAVE